MSKEKQIEEMAKVIDEFTEPLSVRDIHKAEFSEQFAEHLYNAGYRKQSEVAREFIEACDSMLSLVCEMTGLEMTFFGNYAKLKKKYTEGKTNEKDT